MADVDEVILSAWFDWIVANEDVNIDLISKYCLLVISFNNLIC